MYEEYHGVRYKKDVLDYAINMSSRYITDRSQPTAAINLIDECGAYVKIRNQNIDEAIIKNDRQLEKLEKKKVDLLKDYKLEEASVVKTEQEKLKIPETIQQKNFKKTKTVGSCKPVLTLLK